MAIQENYIYRLGNYTLLEEDKNRDCGTKDFSEKKDIYRTSQYSLSKSITADVWTPNTLEKRQERLAKAATSIWRLSQLD
ncbi:HNH endonuclease family protein [Spirosoma luteum]|uniref:HNH endonuclease family protein n=1 Tax=Spirosoma luteum TaxID=431553 RepID=UPI0009FFE907